MPLTAGAHFGPYRVIGQLGKGGMASVFKVYEAGLDRYVALKVLPAEFLHDEKFAARFTREAKVIARLEHPGIVPIYASGIEDGVPWMAMRLIPGGTLSSLLAKQRLPIARSVAILRGVANGLEYAHEQGVIHRDLKPQNILLDQAGQVYLADFGIARIVEGATVLTRAGTVPGTPQYMAPEQALGQRVDHRADVYALGVVAYEMLTGHVPFDADTPMAVMMKHLRETIPFEPLQELPGGLGQAVLKALAKEPADRWSSATAFAAACELELAGSTERATASPRTPPTELIAAPAAKTPETSGEAEKKTVILRPRPSLPGASPHPPAKPVEPEEPQTTRHGPPLAVSALGLILVVGVAFAILMRAGAAHAPKPVALTPTTTLMPIDPADAERQRHFKELEQKLGKIQADQTAAPKKAAEAAAQKPRQDKEVPAQQGSRQNAQAPSNAAEPTVGDVRANGKDGLKYVPIPAGTFEMGCVPGDSECSADESPRHSVTLSRSFWLGQTLVTVAAYARFASAAARTMPEAPPFNVNWSLEDHPIVNVNWHDAAAFCEWSGGRLPTEAEWEYAARGGKEGRRYPWGDSLRHDDANYSGTGGRDQWANTSPVGSFAANGYGLYDMAGNTWEWCSDWYGSYSSDPMRDPHGPPTGSLRVLRGGSWHFNPRSLRISFRDTGAPAGRHNGVGFRCSRDVP
jgi:formylglycine-generating enzyme required for sulfatase activity/serine/threonine protein kinase